jgi:hypothetical protein
MSFRTLLADVLPDLKFAETIDHKRANDESCEQCSQAGERSPERQIAEYTKWREIVKQFFVQQPIEQSASVQSWVVGYSSLAHTRLTMRD